MALSWLLAVLILIALDLFNIGSGDGHDEGVLSGGEHQGTQLPPGCLLGDSSEAIITGADRYVRIAPHHDDYEGVDWRGVDDATNRRGIYQDAVVLPIEPV